MASNHEAEARELIVLLGAQDGRAVYPTASAVALVSQALTRARSEALREAAELCEELAISGENKWNRHYRAAWRTAAEKFRDLAEKARGDGK